MESWQGWQTTRVFRRFLAMSAAHANRPMCCARQALPTAFTEDTQYRFGALHFAYLLVLLVPDHLFPFALWTAFPSSLTGRCSGLLRALCRHRTRVP